MATLTGANSAIFLTVPGIFSAPVQLQGYDVDDAWSVESSENAEVKDGVDGRMSYGWVFKSVPIEFVLQADSASIDVFETWDAQEQAAREKFACNGVIRVPATSKQYTLTKGILTRVPRLPSVGKVLKPRRFTVQFERVTPAAM